MTPDEIREAFNQLEAMLRGHGMGWVVDEVQEAIRAGRTTLRKEPIQDSSTARKFKVTADSLTSVAFTAEEELDLLVTAIRRAVIDAGRMEQALVSQFRDEAEAADVPAADVIFVSDDPDISDRVIASARSFTPGRSAAIDMLSVYLDQLMAEARRAP
jgi:hypothetical protein